MVHTIVMYKYLSFGYFAGKSASQTKSAWAAVWVILIGLAMAAGGAYLVYKYRLRVSLLHYIFMFADFIYPC